MRGRSRSQAPGGTGGPNAAAVLALGAVLVVAVGSVSWAAGQAPVPLPPPTTTVDTVGATTPTPPASEVAEGAALFAVACSSCHGPEGRGSDRGPSLIGVGAASADFYLSTGRMPLDEPRAQAERKKPAYPPDEIRRLVAYVASLSIGPVGPAVPTVHPDRGGLAEGNRLYANNCAACHNSSGAGGALGHAVYAPPLDQATPLQVAEAIRVGPGAMPLFGPDTLDDNQVDSIVRYVRYLRHPDDRGGFGLGHLGPITEGFTAWFVGLGLILAIARCIGTKD